MFWKSVSYVLLIFLVIGMLLMAFKVQPGNSLAGQPTITISYSMEEPQKIYYAPGYFDTPSHGYVYLLVNMTIMNNGYGEPDSFDTSPAYFSVVASNTRYSVEIMLTSYVGDWSTVNVLNGYMYSGALVFEIPSSANVTSIDYGGYTNSYQRYNIQWINTSSIPEFPLITVLLFVPLILLVAVIQKRINLRTLVHGS